MNELLVQGEIDQVIEQGAHNDNMFTNYDVLQMVRQMVHTGCMNTGINTHIGYEGVERNEDLILYLHSLIKKAEKH